MAIAFDAQSTGTIAAAASSTTFNHTATGSNLIMTIYVTQQNDSAANRVVASNVTFNAVASTFVKSFTNATNDTTYCFQLIAPASGVAHTVSVTRTGTTNTAWITVLTHTGAAQSGQPDSSNTVNIIANTLTVSTTVVANNSWTLLGVFDSDGGTVTASTNSTQRSTATTFVKAFDSNAAVAPGNFSMTVTRASGTSTFQGVIVSISPAGAAVTVLPFKTLLGVGI